MIRVLIVDDHPALRAGLSAVLRAEPGLVVLGTAESEADVWPELARTRPDVVILDYHLPSSDGLTICRRVKRTLPPPGVLLYSAYADTSLVIPALLAGADGMVSKSAAAAELYDAIRQVSRGERVMPPVSREVLTRAHRQLDEDDLPLLAMLLDGTRPGDVAETMGMTADDLAHRIDRMISRLKVEVATPRPA